VIKPFQKSALLCAVVVCGLLVKPASAATLSGIFSDHMVLQREMPLPVWGTAAPGAKVTVKLGTQEMQTVADGTGRWRVSLPSTRASDKPTILTVTDETGSTTLQDILIGDVWLCSGQSNMEMILKSCEFPEDIQEANFPLIRHVKIPKKVTPKPMDDISFATGTPRWEVCSPETAPNFSAVGFYFARKIQKETGVPIGLVNSSWGGTPIETWLAPEGVASVAELKGVSLEPAKSLKAKAQQAIANPAHDESQNEVTSLAPGETPPPSPATTAKAPPRERTQDKPHHLYNGMIRPLAPFALKGVLWYQGEANRDEGDSYFHKLRALIGGWRQVWGQGDFSFYIVQLASFGTSSKLPPDGKGFPPVRLAQLKALSIPHTGMAVTIDIGEAKNIHPKNKTDTGERLALWALKNDYGQASLECSGPLFKEIKLEDGKIRILFNHTGTGLMVGKKEARQPVRETKDDKLAQFAIAGVDGVWKWANAVIDGQAVVVSAIGISSPVAVRYAYSQNPEGCNLYNREGLPASPFEASSNPVPAKN
jgi:sialate O-acetylesterase